MVEFSRSKEDFLKKFLELPNGIPSEDTINRVFYDIDNQQLADCFRRWVSSLVNLSDNQVIAIDGKTLRGAKSKGKKSPVHMVSAWASANNLVLGQTKVNKKSNEIKTIPELLEALFLEGNIVTIDAMGTQTQIADKIIDKQADYILSVKGNQKELFEQIKDEFRFAKEIDFNETIDCGHGRIETRKCTVISDFKFIENTNDKWKKLRQIVKIESIREFKNSNKLKETAIRYYISSLDDSAENYQKHIRSH